MNVQNFEFYLSIKSCEVKILIYLSIKSCKVKILNSPVVDQCRSSYHFSSNWSPSIWSIPVVDHPVFDKNH